jgi:hypothetical protein
MSSLYDGMPDMSFGDDSRWSTYCSTCAVCQKLVAEWPLSGQAVRADLSSFHHGSNQCLLGHSPPAKLRRTPIRAITPASLGLSLDQITKKTRDPKCRLYWS